MLMHAKQVFKTAWVQLPYLYIATTFHIETDCEQRMRLIVNGCELRQIICGSI